MDIFWNFSDVARAMTLHRDSHQLNLDSVFYLFIFFICRILPAHESSESGVEKTF